MATDSDRLAFDFDWGELEDDDSVAEMDDLAPAQAPELPDEFAFLIEPADRVFHADWHLGQYADWARSLDEQSLDELRELYERLASADDPASLANWRDARMLWAARQPNGDQDIGHRVDRLLRVFDILAADGIEPFADHPIAGLNNAWDRTPWVGQPGVCRATRSRPIECAIPSDDPNRPFALCHEASDRLIYRSLRPIEWFYLTATYGANHPYLGSDNYDHRGRALQPRLPIDRDQKYRMPRLEDVRHREGLLVDYFLVAQASDPPQHEWQAARDALLALPPDRIVAAVMRRRGVKVSQALEALGYDTAARVLKDQAPKWFRSRWEKVTDGDSMWPLAELASASVPVLGAAETINCLMQAVERLGWPQPDRPPAYYLLPAELTHCIDNQIEPEVLLEVVLDLLGRLSPQQMLYPGVLQTLYEFSDPTVLDWIETHAVRVAAATRVAPAAGIGVTSGLGEDLPEVWGAAAAINRIDWARVDRWLKTGPPMGLVALDAMAACRPFDAHTMPGALEKRAPKISGASSRRAVREALDRYLHRDPTDRARKMVMLILKHLDQILGRA